MAISFSDSLKNLESNASDSINNDSLNPAINIDNIPIAANLEDESMQIVTYTGEENFGAYDTKYRIFTQFADDNYSHISESKDIELSDNQFNITQEENSQYIPFEMSRKYDGFDLVDNKATLSIHYENINGEHGVSIPVNVQYSDNKIRFGWLVDAGVTQVVGKVKFEIQAVTAIKSTGGDTINYLWKTKCNEDINVLKSLCGDGCGSAISVEEHWVRELIETIAKDVADQVAKLEVTDQIAAAHDAADRAQEAANDIYQYVEDAEQFAKDAENAAQEVVNSTLENYATKQDVEDAVTSIDISDELSNYALKTYVDEQIDTVDVSDQLKDYALSENVYTKIDIDAKFTDTLQNYSTKQDVEDAIAEADISSKLGDYYTKEETYSKVEVDEALSNVDLTDYATKKFVSDTISPISSKVSENAGDISDLGTVVSNIQEVIQSIDTSPNLSYRATYGNIELEDGTVQENMFTLWESAGDPDNEATKQTAVSRFQISGGGGAAGSSILKIGYVTTSPLVVTTNDKALITYTFSGVDSSDDAITEGRAVWKVAGSVVATNTAIGVVRNEDGEIISTEGINTFDITEYLSLGTQKVNLTITDDSGSLVSKTWSVQVVDVRIESDFNDTFFYEVGNVSVDYTSHGAISKDIHFILDGKETGKITTSASGIPADYDLIIGEHGSHLLEIYMTAIINGNSIESNHIFKDIIVYEPGNETPIVGCINQDFTMQQYDTENITYTVYDPLTEAPYVEIFDNGDLLSSRTLAESNTDTYSYKAVDSFEGEETSRDHVLTIKCRDTVKTLNLTVEKIDIDISPVTSGLAFDFNPLGKSNADADRLWSDGDVSMSVSDNFDWINGGYQFDENGDQYFCIKAGTSATIDYQLFADDAKKNGKEFKLVFKTTNVSKPDATFLSCMDNTTESNHIGIQMDVHETFIYGQAGKLHLPYSEEDIIEFEFNISKNTEAIPMVMGYEDGVSTCPMVYGDSHNFTQNTPKVISLGSDDCDLYIYRFKVYNTSLTDRGILNNFIADARNAEEMIARYNRNQIYDENQNLNPDVLAEKCPWLRIIKVEAPHFTAGKKFPVGNTTIEYIYKNGDPILDNWKATDAVHVGQGTSSDDYGASGRNMDLVLKSHKDFNNSPVITLGDGTIVDKVSLTRSSVPVDYLNIKVNIASSENANNALLQKRYNEFNPYHRAFVREDGYDTSIIKDTMEFYNCVVFIREFDDDPSTHTEFGDDNWHFYAIGNIGDSKKTDKTRLTDPDDRYECINEIVDVELPLSDFPVGDEAIGIVETEKFDKSGTYEWRYIWEDGTDEENAEVAEYCKQRWVDFYKFVVNSTDEEFKTHLGDYFVLDSALYYYLFTTRYTMVDNRAKNSFWHYGKTGEVDESGQPIRKWDLAFDYDNDTSLGINNYGDMVYRYGLEDTDVDENGAEVFRESDSTFFCRIRDLFADELKVLYNTLETQNAWHGEGLINQFDKWQSEFPEELWRLDIERKYIRTYNSSHVDGKGDDQFLKNMAHGKKKYQRRQYERNQERYMASKYQSSVASSDANSIIIRCTTPSGNLAVQPNYSLTLTPYAFMYLNVQYANGIIQVPVEELGKPITVPFEGDSTDIIKIYSGYSLQSIGDLSPLYAKTINASSASKLKELIIGNETEGYDNPYLETLTTGANYLLEKLNIENVSGLTDPLNLSVLHNLRELYAHGSSIGGVTFADGGRIEIAELPAINAVTMKNLTYLATLDIADFNKLTTLTVENCSIIQLIEILKAAINLNQVRITNINWNLDNSDLLKRLSKMRGLDKNGYNIDHSVLTGKVHITIIREQELYEYRTLWPELEIVPETIIEQVPVIFKNIDGEILETQYVDVGEDATDPSTRLENPIIPTIPSTVSHDFTFAGWDSGLTSVFSERIVTATYNSALRKYTIKYVSMGTTMQESTGLYGENIPYTGSTPTYTAQEGAYVYHLFNRWNKSGFLLEGPDGNDFDENGVKVVEAVFDKFEYKETSFVNKELSDMSPVEIYALTKLNQIGKINIASIIDGQDPYSIVVGNDIDYDDIESNLIISETTIFNGENHIDTGIKLFDEDKDFVLAIDYEFIGSTTNSVLAQCYQGNGTVGFQLRYNGGVQFKWCSSSSESLANVNSREMIIIRHKKGEKVLTIYSSNFDGVEVNKILLTGKDFVSTATLVFGCEKQTSTIFTNYASGKIHWAKVWYTDLGDDLCSSLALWTHEKIQLAACGFNKYFLSDNPDGMCSFTLLGSHLLSRPMKWNNSNINTGGWANSALNKTLNDRLYNAMPLQIKLLLKKVVVYSSIGNKSYDLSASDCYITIPALIEVDSTQNAEPYNSEGTPISYLTDNSSRVRALNGGDNCEYWTRSPNVGYNSYIWRVGSDGSTDLQKGITNASNELGVLIEISF